MTTKMTKLFYSTPSPYEHKFGYYRALRRKSHIFVSGTTAIVVPSAASSASDLHLPTPPQIHFPNDALKQTIAAFEESLQAVRALGGDVSDVVRVRMFVARTQDCGAVGEGFHKIFGKSKESLEGENGVVVVGQPKEVGVVATMVVVKDGFVEKDMLVEVEVDAVIDE